MSISDSGLGARIFATVLSVGGAVSVSSQRGSESCAKKAKALVSSGSGWSAVVGSLRSACQSGWVSKGTSVVAQKSSSRLSALRLPAALPQKSEGSSWLVSGAAARSPQKSSAETEAAAGSAAPQKSSGRASAGGASVAAASQVSSAK